MWREQGERSPPVADGTRKIPSTKPQQGRWVDFFTCPEGQSCAKVLCRVSTRMDFAIIGEEKKISLSAKKTTTTRHWGYVCQVIICYFISYNPVIRRAWSGSDSVVRGLISCNSPTTANTVYPQHAVLSMTATMRFVDCLQVSASATGYHFSGPPSRRRARRRMSA